VDFPIKNGDYPYSFVSLPEGNYGNPLFWDTSEGFPAVPVCFWVTPCCFAPGTAAKDPPRRAVVFVVGGCTYEEVVLLVQLRGYSLW